MIAGFDGAVIPNMKQMMNRLPSVIEQMTGVPMTAEDKNAAARSGMPQMSESEISQLVQHAQTTNELLSRLLGVNTVQGRIGEKQYRLARGAGNLMTGLGRA